MLDAAHRLLLKYVSGEKEEDCKCADDSRGEDDRDGRGSEKYHGHNSTFVPQGMYCQTRLWNTGLIDVECALSAMEMRRCDVDADPPIQKIEREDRMFIPAVVSAIIDKAGLAHAKQSFFSTSAHSPSHSSTRRQGHNQQSQEEEAQENKEKKLRKRKEEE